MTSGIHYRYVDVAFDRAARTATITVRAPEQSGGSTRDSDAASDRRVDRRGELVAAADGARAGRRHPERCGPTSSSSGCGCSRRRATRAPLSRIDRFILEHQDHWFVREVLGMMRRTFARLDVSSRSMFTFVTPGSCFAGTLLELALASDRVYMLQTGGGRACQHRCMLSPMNFGALPMVNDQSRLAARFYGDAALHRRAFAKRLASRSVLPRPSRSASSPTRRTRSTGTTKCGRRSSRAWRSHPTR